MPKWFSERGMGTENRGTIYSRSFLLGRGSEQIQQVLGSHLPVSSLILQEQFGLVERQLLQLWGCILLCKSLIVSHLDAFAYLTELLKSQNTGNPVDQFE